MRFECARIAASKQTAKDLLEAIALVDGLPSDHPMRPEANRLIELWSQEVLKLAEELFHKGKLDEAIAAARKIPAKATAHKLIEERVKRWQTIWSKAEGIYRKAEAALRKRDWKLAFQMAVQLLELDNKYWQTTKYDQLNTLINISREDGNKLYEAERLAEWGGLTNLLKAIKLADEIRPQSYVYQLAQQAIQKFGRKMMDFAQVALDRRNLSEALDIVSQIPKKAKLEEEVRDFTVLANAQSRVWQDTVVGLEAAISQAQRLRPGRPLYTKAQQLIARWQAEIEGVAQLERARSLAQGGTVGDLLAAISAASLVSSTNPRWNEAQSEMQKWQTEAETIEDRPILDIADQYASRGDMNALQAAIAQASQVSTGRSLYPEAQGKINQWTRQIQQIQDQPYLDQARAYAAAGNLQAAINVAERIRPGRALYNEAQADVSSWSRQIRTEVARVQAQAAQAQAQQNLQNARQAASSGQPNGLANAIQIASQVSTSGAVQTEIDAAINEWSWQLLSIAKDQAGLNPAGAIAIAQKIPSRAAAHAEAQSQIQIWKQSMKQ
ncbi:MAG: chromosome segregation ATPase [Leptolyngbyaceae cyanobacterium RU_5_1]|nr:chromosome segregation ATPase [Leptolyngbyaceae cyanobacterium RU_5_1]